MPQTAPTARVRNASISGYLQPPPHSNPVAPTSPEPKAPAAHPKSSSATADKNHHPDKPPKSPLPAPSSIPLLPIPPRVSSPLKSAAISPSRFRRRFATDRLLPRKPPRRS